MPAKLTDYIGISGYWRLGYWDIDGGCQVLCAYFFNILIIVHLLTLLYILFNR